MKKKYALFIILANVLGYAQAPATYYTSANGTGYALKSQLKTIISTGHIDRGYGSGLSQTDNGLWSAYGTTDRDNGIGYENDNTIVDVWSENPTAIDPYNFNFNSALGTNAGQCGTYVNEGNCYNREHMIPQSYFGQQSPMRNDVQHVYPTDGKVNAIHNDFSFGRVGTASITSQNGSKLGSANNSGYSTGFAGTVFEPIDEFKGDIARVYLYFATRYEDQMSTFYSTYTTPDCRAMFDGSNNKVFNSTFLNILLTWNAQDPVSVKETKRNNACFEHQGNRNPFIDNNAYVTSIWGSPLLVDEYQLSTAIALYPNPSSDNKININCSIILDEIQIININGQILQMIKKPMFNDNNYTIDNLPKGFYFVKMNAENQSVTKKIIVN